MRYAKQLGTAMVLVLFLVGLFGLIARAEVRNVSAAGESAQVSANEVGVVSQNYVLEVEGSKQGPIRGSRSDGKISGLSFHYNVKSPRDAATGQASGKRTHSPLVIRKRIDKATPLLMRALTTNEVLKSVTVWVEVSEGVLYRVRLTDAFIVDITQSGEKGGEATEEVSFTFQKIEWTYTDGGITHEDTWDQQR